MAPIRHSPKKSTVPYASTKEVSSDEVENMETYQSTIVNESSLSTHFNDLMSELIDIKKYS